MNSTKDYRYRDMLVEMLLAQMLAESDVKINEHQQEHVQEFLLEFFDSLASVSSFSWDDLPKAMGKLDGPGHDDCLKFEEFGAEYWRLV